MRVFVHSVGVARFGGVWREVMPDAEGVVTPETLRGADRKPGGHRAVSAEQMDEKWWLRAGFNHEVSDDVLAELERDGFGAGIREVPDPVPDRVREHKGAAEPPRVIALEEAFDQMVDRLVAVEAANAELRARLDAMESERAALTG